MSSQYLTLELLINTLAPRALAYTRTTGRKISIESYYTIASIYPVLYVIMLDDQIDTNEKKVLRFLELQIAEKLRSRFEPGTLDDRMSLLEAQILQEIDFLLNKGKVRQLQEHFVETLLLIPELDGDSCEYASKTVSRAMCEVALVSDMKITSEEIDAIEAFLARIGLHFDPPAWAEKL